MTVITLGLGGAIGSDAAAALFIDGTLVAAVEEERLLRRKHAKDAMPYHAARECLQYARVRPQEVNIVALAFAPISIFSPARWHYARRYWYAPDRALDSLLNGNRRYRRYLQQVRELLEQLHIPLDKTSIVPVQHQLAHASSGYLMSGTDEKTAILSIDARGEYASMFLGYGENGKIHCLKQFYNPDSLSGMYAAMTDYLGFDVLDGEYKVMGIAPFGDSLKYDLSPLINFGGKSFQVNTKLISTVGLRRYKTKSKGHYFSQKLVDLLGPRREGNLVDDPYIHYAAAIQKQYEDVAVGLVMHYLSSTLAETGRLAIVGTGSLNIRLNRRLLSLPQVDKLIVHPACADAGTAIGAAAYVASKQKQKITELKSVFLGPDYSKEQCLDALVNHREKANFEKVENPAQRAAQLLAEGELVAWFQGRMEFGARGLGNRSILANPCHEGIAESINKQVKFRERWRPFSPSIIDSFADEFLNQSAGDEYMAVSTHVNEKWLKVFPSLVYTDGTARAQIVSADSNPIFYQLLKTFQEISGYGMVINTTFCRPGEALVCTPEDALNVFHGTDLKYMMMENLLITKRKEPETW